MPTKSEFVSDQQLAEMRAHIVDLNNLKKEIKLAEDSGITLSYTQRDIDNQIASLELIIRTYQMK